MAPDALEEGLGGATQQTIYQTPEWETRTRPRRHSFLRRWLPAKVTGAGAAPASSIPRDHHSGSAIDKDTDTSEAPTAHPGGPTALNVVPGAASGLTMRQRLDRTLPPQRTYCGRSRRFLLLFVLLPLAVLFLLIIPLAIGLGIGLSRNHGGGSSNLPLPSNTATFTGDLTYYEPGLGACGLTSTSSDDIVSVSHIIFDAASSGSNPNANPLCGKKIRIERDSTGTKKRGNSSVDVTVVDRCTGCSDSDLDVSLSVFTQLAKEEEGRVEVSWAWLN